MKLLYDTIFRRTSTYFVGIAASVFFFERAFDLGSEAIFDSVNAGVRSLHNSRQDALLSLFPNPCLPETMEGHQAQVRIGEMV